MQSRPFESMEVGTAASHRVPSSKSKYGMDAYMAVPWQHILEVRVGTCVEN